MKKISILCYHFFINLSETIVSLISVILFSNLITVLKFKKHKNNLVKEDVCIILGNGPSLKSVIDSNLLKKRNKDVFAVNLFFRSEYFEVLKPKYYFLADTDIFNPLIERHFNLVNEIVETLNKVSWQMSLLIPSSKKRSKSLDKIINNNIKIVFLNTTPLNGSKAICHFFYKNNLGMPRAQTVINFAIFSAINLGYSKINLYGVDHSWTKDLSVNDQNEVCYGDRHVYNTNLTVIKKRN